MIHILTTAGHGRKKWEQKIQFRSPTWVTKTPLFEPSLLPSRIHISSWSQKLKPEGEQRHSDAQCGNQMGVLIGMPNAYAAFYWNKPNFQSSLELTISELTRSSPLPYQSLIFIVGLPSFHLSADCRK